MATSRTRPALDDEPLSDADRAAIDRALSVWFYYIDTCEFGNIGA